MSYSIFISYRREDSQTAVNALYYDLVLKFGSNAVFADTAVIKPGDTWDKRILNSLDEAKIILVVIGNNWLCTEKDKPDQLRICNNDDWVRKEIERATTLKKIIIPVLIDNAPIPYHPDLPELINNLKLNQAQTITFRAGRNEEIETFMEFLGKTLDNLNSPDNVRRELEKIINKEKYEILKRIGIGNRAIVYLGRDKGLNRYVAIKVIKNIALKEDFVDIIKQSAKINDCVSNSIQVLGAYIDREPIYVIMTYLDKGTLREMINENEGRPLPYNDIQQILVNIGEALTKIHNKGLAHCNVTPSNVILANDLEPFLNPLSHLQKVIKGDILKKLSDISVSNNNTLYKEELCYLAPEIFDNRASRESLNKRKEKIDQYMLGLIGYELLTGSIPDTLDSGDDLIKKGYFAFKALPQLTGDKINCPYKFAEIIHKMIDYDPDKRYVSIKDAAQAINKLSFDVFEIANDSYARCMQDGDSGNKFFKAFYTHLINKLPVKEAVKLKKRKIGELNETEPHKQYSKLREAIFILLMFGQNNSSKNEPNILTRIAEKHNQGKGNYKISPDSYKIFTDALIDTICGTNDIPAFDKRCTISEYERGVIKNGWKEALRPGCDYMISKY